MSSRPKVAIAGAHTELARSLAAAIGARDLPIDIASYTDSANIDDGLELLGPALLEGTDLLILAAPGSLAAGLAKGLVARGKPVLDVAGETVETATLLWPFLQADAGRQLHTAGAYAIAPGLAGPLVAVAKALAPLSPSRIIVDTAESAAVADRPGMDELMAQVRAVYTMQDPKAEVFSDQLAFSTIASAGLDGVPAEAADAALAALISAAVDTPVVVCRSLVPTMCVDSAMVHVDLPEALDRGRVVDALRMTRGLRVVTEGVLTAADSIDRDDALVGRVHVDGAHVSLWLAADRLRHGGATPAALALEQWIAADSRP